MSDIQSQIKDFVFKWKSFPKGMSGKAQVELSDKRVLEVEWKKDLEGIWIRIPTGIYGFDLQGVKEDLGEIFYDVSQRNSCYEWNHVSAIIGPAGALKVTQASSVQSSKLRMRAQMPGKILRILTEPGKLVQKNDPVLVMEAMKMENEIRAPQSGQVSEIKVEEGQAVETGADLLWLELRS